MQAKRSRLDSFGESDSNNGGALKKTATMPAETESEQTQPMGILTVSSPKVTEVSVHRHINVNGELSSFLEKCHFCKKRMFNADAFMYGYLRAFCSPECRSKHIAIEKLVKGVLRAQKERASAKENSSNINNNNDVKNGSGSAQPYPSDSE